MKRSRWSVCAAHNSTAPLYGPLSDERDVRRVAAQYRASGRRVYVVEVQHDDSADRAIIKQVAKDMKEGKPFNGEPRRGRPRKPRGQSS